MKIEISDDSGLLAIIDPDAYRSFVNAEWTWDMMQQHFLREMRDRHLLIWHTGLEHRWQVEVAVAPTTAKSFRELIGGIQTSRGRLLLTSYDSLTMAAQFPDVRLPQAHEKAHLLNISPGFCDCRIIQLSDPASGKPFEEPVNFIYEFSRTTSPKDVWNEIPWGETEPDGKADESRKS